MRLLVICPHYEPDVAPTGIVMSAIGAELARAGHRLHVVTSLPWYEHHRIVDGWGGRLVRSQVTDWGRITRVHPFPTAKTSVAARALGFAGFSGLGLLAGLSGRARPDGVLAMSPPITLGGAGWAAARRHRVPLVLNLQDIFPDAAAAVGAVGRRSAAAAGGLERWLYRRAGAVTVLSEDQRANVAAKLDPGWATELRVIPNFVDTDRIRPRSRRTRYRFEHSLGDRTVVMYAGNLGLSQPLELMVAAARACRNRDDVVFVVNGAGSARPGLAAASAGLDNLVLVDFQPPERLSEVLASADVHVIALRRGLGPLSVPSKLFSIMAAGRPVVAAVDPGTEIPRLVEAASCGVAVAPEDPDGFTAAVEALIDDPGRRRAMGERGRAFAESWTTPAEAAAAYAELFKKLANRRPEPRGAGPTRLGRKLKSSEELSSTCRPGDPNR